MGGEDDQHNNKKIPGRGTSCTAITTRWVRGSRNRWKVALQASRWSDREARCRANRSMASRAQTAQSVTVHVVSGNCCCKASSWMVARSPWSWRQTVASRGSVRARLVASVSVRISG